MVSLIDEIVSRANIAPNSIAIEGDSLCVSYNELLKLSYDYATKINKEKISNSWIGIDVSIGWKAYAAILGCWLTGNGYVPINFDFPESRIDEIEKQVGWELLIDNSCDITNSKTTDKIDVIKGGKAYLLFTSGTTGKPKGVPVTQENLMAFTSHYLNHKDIEFNSEDKFLQSYELTFDVSIFCFLMPFLVGGTLILPNETNSKQLGFFKAIRDFKVTVTSFVPSVIRLTLEALPRVVFPSIRYSFFSGESLLGSWAKVWIKSVPEAKVYNCYGPTETVIVCTEELLNNLNKDYFESKTPLPLGSKFEEISFEIEEGEIVYSGRQVFNGYLNQEPINRYFSGDLAHFDENSKLIFDGRKDNQIQWNGYRIELDEIDKVLTKSLNSWVKTVYLKEPQKLVVFSNQEIIKMEKEFTILLPSYYKPSRIIKINKLPLNVNGKVDINKLKVIAFKNI